MNNKSITPSVQQPVNRVASGQLPSALAELSEAALAGAEIMSPSFDLRLDSFPFCAFDGDE